MARTAEQKREVVAQVRALLAAGASESEQLAALTLCNVNSRELRGIRNEILTGEVEQLRSATAEETFLTYKFRMEGCVRSLDDVVGKAAAVSTPSPGILAAAVSAVKAKSQIIDSILNRGQSLGVIHKAPKTTLKIGGIVIANASNTDLKQLVRRKVAALEQLAARTAFGDYLEEPDGQLYYDEPAKVIDITPAAEEAKRPVRRKVVAK